MLLRACSSFIFLILLLQLHWTRHQVIRGLHARALAVFTTASAFSFTQNPPLPPPFHHTPRPLPLHVLLKGFRFCVTRHTSHVTRHTSHVTRHTSHVTRHTPHVTREQIRMERLLHQVPRHRWHTRTHAHARTHTHHLPTIAPHVTRHSSHVTRHTSHVTRHTSHVTRHTSHVTLVQW